MAKKLLTPNWDKFVNECLKGPAILQFDGERPDKIILAKTFEGANKAITIFQKLKIKNWVVMGLEGHNRSVSLMAAAMLARDFPMARIFVEDPHALQDGVFLSTEHKPTPESLAAFMEMIKNV